MLIKILITTRIKMLVTFKKISTYMKFKIKGLYLAIKKGFAFIKRSALKTGSALKKGYALKKAFALKKGYTLKKGYALAKSAFARIKIHIPAIFKKAKAILLKRWLLLFYIASVSYFELLYKLWSTRHITVDFLFPILFSITIGFLLFILTSVLPVKIQKFLAPIFTFLLLLIYATQLIYYDIFKMPLYLYSVVGAKDAMQFGSVIATSLLHNWVLILLLLLPLAAIIFMTLHFKYFKTKLIPLGVTTGLCLISYMLSLVCVNLTGDSPVSQSTQYYGDSSLELSITKLGLLTAMRLDLKNLLFDNAQRNRTRSSSINTLSTLNTLPALPAISSLPINPESANPYASHITPPKIEYNMLDIDFTRIIENETDTSLIDMHQYFAALRPSTTNDYTGMFEGCNLIFMTCEGFSTYTISEELTPTLYEMTHTGFVFENFYNPVWGVSTSDGEYVACQGLIPKSGVWSFSKSSNNFLPFALGNQFKGLGYPTYAYHNHTYTYYDRDASHPNMGYDYKGLGNGLEVTPTWPESDLEMMTLTAPEFIAPEPFHAYFMTVSGHLQYNFSGNFIAKKNKPYVETLPYSDSSKAYIACNMELEFALSSLVEQLEAAEVLDNTVFVLSPDHYPYGLEKEKLDELAGHEVESNFELYKSSLIIWKPGMEPVMIDEPCSSLDILPTVSNLFGLEFDSRLLMGNDILSTAPPLVIFSNRSWISERGTYNSQTNTMTFTDGTENDKDYKKAINQMVDDKFWYSEKILETDYYGTLFTSLEQ